MKYRIVLSQSAIEDLRILDRNIAWRILNKLAFFSRQSNPLRFAKSIEDKRIGSYRFRIGDYIVIFDANFEASILSILRIKHRKDAYQL